MSRYLHLLRMLILLATALVLTSGPSLSFTKRKIGGTEIIIDEKGLDTLDLSKNDTPHNLIPSEARYIKVKPKIPVFFLLNVGRMTDLDGSCYLRLMIRGKGFPNQRIDRDVCQSGAPVNNYWIINHSFIPTDDRFEFGLTAFLCDSCDIEAVVSITQPE